MRLASAAMVGALLALLALMSTAHGRVLTQTDRVTCNSKPPNGTWVMEHFTPLSPASPDLTRHARSVLFMNEVEENFYIGDGSAVYFLADIADGFNGTQWEYHVALFFDLESCMLSGTIFNLNRGVIFPDASEYFYDGETIGGVFLFPMPTATDTQMLQLFPQVGRHQGRHLGDP